MESMDQRTGAPLRIVGGQLVEARRVALASQASAPHRLEPVASLNDVLYINDSRSTFLDATLGAMAELDQRLVWIAGVWSDEMTEGHLLELLQERGASVVLYGQKAPLAMPDGLPFYLADDLRMAVFLAREIATPGDVVLFSPACPSGNGYANYEERGAAFKQAVRDL